MWTVDTVMVQLYFFDLCSTISPESISDGSFSLLIVPLLTFYLPLSVFILP
jgi:hypothetical protein